MQDYQKFVGLDVHKDTTAVAIADKGRRLPEPYGNSKSDPDSIGRLARKLGTPEEVTFCYEAGPCGYGIYRHLMSMGYECVVAAPSLIPRRSGERIKTDRRDAVALARCHRSGDLVPVWVPDQQQEAIRDLVRCREDMKRAERRAKQRLNAFLLRHGRVFGRTKWTQIHFTWLDTLDFSDRQHQVVLHAYIDAVRDAVERVAEMEREMARALETWSLAPLAQGLMALRGVSVIASMVIVAELGDITRFDSPRQLMSYLGLVPSEHTTGDRRRLGAITKTGNGHVRRILAESAWTYRYRPRKSPRIQKRAAQTSRAVQDIAWKAQKRLSFRYAYLHSRGKPGAKVCTAISRELSGFIWAIAWEVMAPQKQVA